MSLTVYFDQFNIIALITIQAFWGDWLITFTNSALMMAFVVIVV